ncbi:MAG: tyrosine-type recombinase/integrase [Gammaproteobacteria bacterium]
MSPLILCMAIRWGIVLDNPCKNVKRKPEKKRNRYITHDEYQQFYNFLPDDKKGWFSTAYYTGLRQGDILKIKLEDIQMDGLFVEIGKTGNSILIEWTPEFKRVIEIAQSRAKKMNSIYLFPNESGCAYTSSGFQSNWQKLMKKALEEKIITDRFRFHDIRRKTATDIEQSKGREQARQLLGHSDQKTTGIYISGIQKVRPLS